MVLVLTGGTSSAIRRIHEERFTRYAMGAAREAGRILMTMIGDICWVSPR